MVPSGLPDFFHKKKEKKILPADFLCGRRRTNETGLKTAPCGKLSVFINQNKIRVKKKAFPCRDALLFEQHSFHFRRSFFSIFSLKRGSRTPVITKRLINLLPGFGSSDYFPVIISALPASGVPSCYDSYARTDLVEGLGFFNF